MKHDTFEMVISYQLLTAEKIGEKKRKKLEAALYELFEQHIYVDSDLVPFPAKDIDIKTLDLNINE